MQPGEVLQKCHWIVQDAGYNPEEINLSNFLDYSDFVRDIVLDWDASKRTDAFWLKDFAESLRRLRDDFDKRVASDPMMLYSPAHSVAEEFHRSTALIRYFRSGNRTSKTQSGVADNYWVVTQQHPYRKVTPWPVAVGVVGLEFSKYAHDVFEKKYVTGEGGNPLSPVFPEGGKWFYKYDSAHYIVYIACPECANKGVAGSCKHPKGTVTLYSDYKGPSVIQGQQKAQFQFDEQISREFFSETVERLKTVPNSGLIVTETPLNGKGFWTHTELARLAEGFVKVGKTDQLMVSLHTIDQRDAGLTPIHLIEASMETMSEVEIDARIKGKPAAFHEQGVFDSHQISEMYEDVADPVRGLLVLPSELGNDSTPPLDPRSAMMRLRRGDRPNFIEDDKDNLRVWKFPEDGKQYIIGVDVAQGLTGRDASVASVLEMVYDRWDITFELVSQLHGWVNPRTLAEDIVRLSLWYNEALLVVERNGPGSETLRSIKEFGYWSVFRDQRDPADSDYLQDPLLGVSTDTGSKPVMLSILQQAVWNKKTRERTIKVPCSSTIDEMGSFGQERTDSGLNYRFRGAKGMHDDRVISLMVAVYAAKAFGCYDYAADERRRRDEAVQNLSSEEKRIWEQLHLERKHENYSDY